MSKILWSSDTHFDISGNNKLKKFCESVSSSNADLLVITGDISNSKLLEEHLEVLSTSINIPICFTLGNHDYYFSSISRFKDKLKRFLTNKKFNNLHWMEEDLIYKLSSKDCLIGSAGWWDGYYGNEEKAQGFLQEIVMIQDYTNIEELAVKKTKRKYVLEGLTDKIIERLDKLLKKAFQDYDTIYLMTHVPPFKESCLYDKSELSERWLYHFCCKRLGDYIINIMSKNENKNLVVLSGHVHYSSIYFPLKNVSVFVANSSYFKPKIFTSLCV